MESEKRFCLRVRNLPAALSTATITSLLTHYGATRVRVFPRQNAAVSSGREPGAIAKHSQDAIATFETREAQKNAQKRLHLLELAGHYLQVAPVGEKDTTKSKGTEVAAVGTQNNVHAKYRTPLLLSHPIPPPLPPTPAPVQNPVHAPVPLAPHLGLDYAPSPLLEYKYPRATESIVYNIANALIALPRFYTQVLHLMNKMNLPPPFKEDSIPGRFTAKKDTAGQNSGGPRGMHSERLKRCRVDENSNARIVRQEEEEEEEEGAESDVVGQGAAVENSSCTAPVHSPLSAHRLSNAGSSTTHSMTGYKESDEPCRDYPHEVISKQLPQRKVFLPIKKSTRLTPAFHFEVNKDGCRNASRLLRPGVISEKEVNRRRLLQKEWSKEHLTESYTRGVPSNAIVVRNVPHAMDEKDLRSIFGYVLPTSIALDSITITLLPARGSAKIAYPDEVVATSAVDVFHGLQFEGKTLIVSFDDTSTVVSDASAVATRWTLQDLESRQLTATQLNAEKAMKGYQRGEPSDTLFVKNLADRVTLADLIAVFEAILPPESVLDARDIRHFTAGRMKCQAFVKYPTAELAHLAILRIHGVVLKDKPLIVCFRKPRSD
uniref:RRM domain-containing protein n=1 Tax=Peronospora matthiolae TaxID=2874970 RepID=A0AAV1T8F2_9STRA